MLKYIILIISLGYTVLSALLFDIKWPLPLYILICFIVSYIVISCLYFIILYLYSLTINKDREYDKRSKVHFFILNITIDFVLFFMGVRIKVENEHLIPKNKKVLLVGNHRSNFDPVVVLSAFKYLNLTSVSKESNFHLPIVGPFMRCCSFMEIDRENNRNALKTILKCIKYIQSDTYSILIYPEGTRNKEDGILPFRAGSLKIAYKSKCPLVIFSMRNTSVILKRFPFKTTKVIIRVLDVLDYDKYQTMQTLELAKYARDLIKNDLGIKEEDGCEEVTM